MKKSKQIFLLLLIVVLAFALSACGKKKNEAPKRTSAPTGGSNVKLDPMEDLTAAELAEKINMGWAVRSSLDVINNTNPPIRNYELTAGNPAIKDELIEAIKAEGFNTIKIPVIWENHYVIKDGKYTIQSQWMDRVKEVVDYAYSKDLYVILSLADTTWTTPTSKNRETAKAILTDLWSQIATTFQAYNERLIFEAMSDSSLIGEQYAIRGTADAYLFINEMNETFVKLIRQAKGNNAKRILIICPYAGSTNSKVISSFIVPNDKKLLVGLNGMLPYDFAVASDPTSLNYTANFDPNLKTNTAPITQFISRISGLQEKGYTVLVTEFGTVDKQNTAVRATWTDYVLKELSTLNVKTIVRDSGLFYNTTAKGEPIIHNTFGLFDRRELKPKYPEIFDVLKNYMK